jgi:hypothetical protein
VAAVIQPGGSVRDDEVIAAADEHGACSKALQWVLTQPTGHGETLLPS